MSTAAMLLAPEREVSSLGTAFDDKIHVLWYRGAWNRKKAARGASRIYVLNRGQPDDIDIGNSFSASDELGELPLLARLFGGHHLLLWTYGDALCAACVRGDADGREPLVLHTGFRLQAFGGARPRHALDEFLSWFEDSPFRPDLGLLEREYASERLSAARWMKAFGVTGARDPAAVDAQACWDDFEVVAGQLARGETADAARLRRVNAMARQLDENAKLPRRPARRPGALADRVASVDHALEELLGAPGGERWRAVRRAAAFYWDFSDCEGAQRRLTVGTDRRGLGTSASVGRLMMHYPVRLRRDGLFWALAAREAEAANGHAYVDGLSCLAECSHAAGAVLVVFPSAEREAFRGSFGIDAAADSPPLDRCWSAEVFPDLPGLLKADVFGAAQAWLVERGATGLCVRGEADGSLRWCALRDGAASADGPPAIPGLPAGEGALSAALRTLDHGGACSALGLPDLFAPGQWHEGAYAGAADEAGEARRTDDARAALGKDMPETADARVIADAGALFPVEDIRRERDDGVATAVEVNRFWIELPVADAAYQRALRDDLRARGLAGRTGDVWFDGARVFGQIDPSPTERDLTMRCLWRGVLGGLPDGTRLVFRLVDIEGRSWALAYRIDRRVAEPRSAAAIRHWLAHPAYPAAGDAADPAAGDPGEGPGEADELTRELEFSTRFEDGVEDESLLRECLLEGRGRRYFRLDLSSIEHLKAPILRPAEAELRAVGARPLGDVLCDQFSGHFMRCHVLEGAPEVWIPLMVYLLEEPMIELYTEFDGPRSLTTTTNPYVRSREDLHVEYQVMDAGLGAPGCLAAHLSRVEAYRADGCAPVPAEPGLVGFCQALERFIRRLG